MDKTFAFELDITADDEQVLRNALKYYPNPSNLDIGWSVPGYLDTFDYPYDFKRLINAGLLEKHPHVWEYRITQLGRDTITALDKAKQNLPSTHPEMVEEVIEEADESAPVIPQFLMDMTPEQRMQFVTLYNQTPTTEDKLRAQIADLKKRLRDVENERDVRGAILEQLVGIRTELIDDKSNSWIDSIEKINNQVKQGREAQKQLEKANRDIEQQKAEHNDLKERFDTILDNIWALVRPDDKSWEYPAQVVRYVEYAVQDAKKPQKGNWYYALGEDEIPQKFDEKPMNYDGPFDTWEDAVTHLLQRNERIDTVPTSEIKKGLGELWLTMYNALHFLRNV